MTVEWRGNQLLELVAKAAPSKQSMNETDARRCQGLRAKANVFTWSVAILSRGHRH